MGHDHAVGGRFSIADLRRVYGHLVLSAIAEFVQQHDCATCTPDAIAAHATTSIRFEEFGLGDARVWITDFAMVRTFRLINDGRWWSGAGSLNTQTPDMPAVAG